jgi:glucosylceramidase
MVQKISLLAFIWALLFCSCRPAENEDFSAISMITDPEALRFLEVKELQMSDKPLLGAAIINVNAELAYQTMDGFGYTLTGGSAYLINQMDAEQRSALLKELFGKEKNSIGVSFLRLSVGASDLDPQPFSYNDLPEGETDPNLEYFSLAPDQHNLIPVLKEILDINPKIKLMGSPWSPPTWMKDNGDTRGGSLMPKYYDAYAHYLVKYIQGMEQEGIDIYALTVQNEPLHPGNNPSLLMLAKDQATFVKNHLGPAFEKAGIHTKIIIYDHNADRPDYPISILNDPEANKYIDGSAFHLYGGEIEALSEVHEAHPDKNLYFTEQWVGVSSDFKQELNWHTKELIIGATRNWSKTVLEWNLAADPNQEPHTDRGGCVGCLGAITIDGNLIEKNPAFYIIAHASKYVAPGSVRIASNYMDDLPNVAFKTPQGKVVVIVLNNGQVPQTFCITIKDRYMEAELNPGAVGTFVMNAE